MSRRTLALGMVVKKEQNSGRFCQTRTYTEEYPERRHQKVSRNHSSFVDMDNNQVRGKVPFLTTDQHVYSHRMSIHRSLRLKQRRTVVSSLFGFTFLATLVTVSASNFLPCPARPYRHRLADSGLEEETRKGTNVTIAKRPRRWIEEKHPSSS